jgi:transcriptional regulator with XRE-family HTH domain
MPPTDYQLAKRLGMTPQRISNCRRSGGTLDNEAAWKLAKVLGMPITDVIAYMEEDRAKTDKQRAFWSAQLPCLLPSIAIAATVLATVTGGSLIDGSGVVQSLIDNETEAWAVSLAIHYAHLIMIGLGLMLVMSSSKPPTRYARIASAAADPR